MSNVRDVWDDDVHVSYHEAGHAVAAVLVDWPFRYVTIRPRRESRAGHLIPRPRRRDRNWSRTSRWEAYGIVTAAGLAAETAWLAYMANWSLDDEDRRACMAGVSGRGSLPGDGDLPTLRWIARAVHYASTPAYDTDMFGPVSHGPAFDPAWADTPDGVGQIGAHLWHGAVDLVAEAWPAITTVADRLRRDRTVYQRCVQTIVADRTSRPEPARDPDLIGRDFWPGRLGRLAWRPHGQARKAVAA